MDNAVQIAILLSSASVAFLMGCRTMGARRLGFLIGLAGQPFWFWTSVTHGQWAITALAIWYSACHLRGFLNTYPHETDWKAGQTI